MICVSKPPDENATKSKRIDKELTLEGAKLKQIIQLLLLGTGESGKTTIIKQMKIIHINGFSENEKMEKVANIRQNIHESIFTLASNMSKISPPVCLKTESNQSAVEFILKLGSNEPPEYSDEYFEHVKSLWADDGIKETFKRSNEFQLIDSAQHFLDRIDDIKQPNYIPTVQDMLFCRIMTVAISKIEFKIPYQRNNVEFWMYDVGGQRGERKKWISVFEGIHAILFLIAASDFDQTLREDETKNRLEEAFQVFSDIFWSRFVRKAGKIVFLNKQDVLKYKIENGRKVEKYFPEFQTYQVKDKHVDRTNQYDKAKYFIKDQIEHISQNKPDPEIVDIMPGTKIKMNVNPQQVYIHFTIATDTKNVKLVFESVKDIIVMNNLGSAGLN